MATGIAPAGARGVPSRKGQVGWMPQRLPVQGDAGFSEQVWETGIGECGRGIVHPALWSVPICELSAGNQRRAQLALMLAQQPALLVKDEPTYYLGLATIEALEEALQRRPGKLVVASHEHWLIEHWHGSRLHLEGWARQGCDQG